MPSRPLTNRPTGKLPCAPSWAKTNGPSSPSATMATALSPRHWKKSSSPSSPPKSQAPALASVCPGRLCGNTKVLLRSPPTLGWEQSSFCGFDALSFWESEILTDNEAHSILEAIPLFIEDLHPNQSYGKSQIPPTNWREFSMKSISNRNQRIRIHR